MQNRNSDGGWENRPEVGVNGPQRVAPPAPAPVVAAPAVPAVRPDARQEIGATAQSAAEKAAQSAQVREAALQRAVQAYLAQQGNRQNIMASNLAGQQQNLGSRADISMLQQAALGNAPSAAAQQAKIQADEIARQQMAMAQMRGGGNPAALRAAVAAGSQAQQAASGQAALARAQEQMAARNMYAQQYGGAMETLTGQQLALAGLQNQTGATGLAGMQSAAGLGQQGELGGTDALMRALAMRYGMQRDPEQDAVQQAIARLQAETSRANTQAQIDASPSFWERMAGNLLTVGGTLGGAFLGGPAGAMAGASLGSAAGSAIASGSGGGGGMGLGADYSLPSAAAPSKLG